MRRLSRFVYKFQDYVVVFGCWVARQVEHYGIWVTYEYLVVQLKLKRAVGLCWTQVSEVLQRGECRFARRFDQRIGFVAGVRPQRDHPADRNADIALLTMHYVLLLASNFERLGPLPQVDIYLVAGLLVHPPYQALAYPA